MSSEKELKDSSTTEKEQAKKQAERIATLADNKDVRKEAAKVADKLENVIEEEERKTRIPTSTSVLQQQQDEVIKSLDRTKDIIKTLAKESKREITRYTQIVNDYQEQAIEAARVIPKRDYKLMSITMATICREY